MGGAVISLVPMLWFRLFAQRYFVQGITLAGLKDKRLNSERRKRSREESAVVPLSIHFALPGFQHWSPYPRHGLHATQMSPDSLQRRLDCDREVWLACLHPIWTTTRLTSTAFLLATGRPSHSCSAPMPICSLNARRHMPPADRHEGCAPEGGWASTSASSPPRSDQKSEWGLSATTNGVRIWRALRAAASGQRPWRPHLLPLRAARHSDRLYLRHSGLSRTVWNNPKIWAVHASPLSPQPVAGRHSTVKCGGLEQGCPFAAERARAELKFGMYGCGFWNDFHWAKAAWSILPAYIALKDAPSRTSSAWEVAAGALKRATPISQNAWGAEWWQGSYFVCGGPSFHPVAIELGGMRPQAELQAPRAECRDRQWQSAAFGRPGVRSLCGNELHWTGIGCQIGRSSAGVPPAAKPLGRLLPAAYAASRTANHCSSRRDCTLPMMTGPADRRTARFRARVWGGTTHSRSGRITPSCIEPIAHH